MQAASNIHWKIREIYSDTTGSLQFIELFNPEDDEQNIIGQTIFVYNANGAHDFVVPHEAPSANTASRSLLFGTAGLQAAGGPAPDYIIPDNFLLQDGGYVNYRPYDEILAYGPLSNDCYLSLSRELPGTGMYGLAPCSPMNFAGQTGLDFMRLYLSSSPSGAGTVTANPDLCYYAPNAPVTITAVPSQGWVFSYWYAPSSLPNPNPLNIFMTNQMGFLATFVPGCSLGVSTNGDGRVARSPEQPLYASNSIVTLTAIPSPGWSFSGWSGSASGTANPLSVTMTTNKSITANFIPPPPPGVIAQWNFNSIPSDTNTSTGTTAPIYGTGTASLAGGTTGAFGPGNSFADPAGGNDNTAWHTTQYAGGAQSNKTSGVEFDVTTVGYKNIRFSWTESVANQASKYFRLQYTTNGVAFTDFPTATVMSNGGAFQTKSNNLSSYPALNEQLNFGIRIVSEFESTATGSGQAKYVTTSGSTYIPGAGVDFDMVTVYGDSIGGAATLYPVAFVPGNYLQLAVTGAPGASYVLQLSTNLSTANWTSLQTNGSPFNFFESNTVAPQRFYRAVLLP